MKKRRFFIGAAVTSVHLLFAVCAAAEEVSLDDLLTDALSKSPRYTELLLAIAETRGEAAETRTLPNPEFDGAIGAVTGSRDGADNEYELSLSQPLKLSYFGLRNSVGDLLEAAATVQEKFSILELTQSLKLSYAKAWAEQEKARLLGEATQRALEIYQRVEAGAKQGALSRGEQKLLQAEIERLQADLSGVNADLSGSRAELTRLSGSSLGNARLKKPLIQPLPDATAILVTFDEAKLPLQGRFDLLAKIAERQSDLARRDSYPGFTPRIGFEHTAEGDDRLIAGLSIELPFFDRNQAERIKKEAALQASRSWAYYSRGGALRAEIAALLKSISASTEQARRFETKVIPLLRDSLLAYSEQLRAGQGVVFQIWETQRELTEASDRALELWLRTLSMRSELSILVGEEI